MPGEPEDYGEVYRRALAHAMVKFGEAAGQALVGIVGTDIQSETEALNQLLENLETSSEAGPTAFAAFIRDNKDSLRSVLNLYIEDLRENSTEVSTKLKGCANFPQTEREIALCLEARSFLT